MLISVKILCNQNQFYHRHGAEVLESGREGKKQKKISFGGTGYRLGETSDDTEGKNVDEIILTLHTPYKLILMMNDPDKR